MDGGLEVFGISCSVFRPEIEVLQCRKEIEFPVTYLDSRLHMTPDVLAHAIRDRLDDALRPNVGVVLFFGDCHARMYQLNANPRVARLDGLNCGDILLGKQRYKRLMRERAFLMFPEWTIRWRAVIRSLEASCAPCGLSIFRDTHDKLVYLNTGIGPVPEAELDACASAVGLPREVIPVSLDHFRGLISSALARLRNESGGAVEPSET